MAPRKQHDHPSLAENTVVIDNGAYSIKAGLALPDAKAQDCLVVPNCIARNREKKVYVGSQLRKCTDFGDTLFRRPIEKGFVVNWSEEKAIWDNSFFDAGADLPLDPHSTNLVLTEAPNCPQTLQVNTDQMVFEEYEFASYYRCIAPQLNAYNDIQSLFDEASSSPSSLTLPAQDAAASKLGHLPAECLLLIDAGYSHTTITPILCGRPLHSAIRRLDIGGKVLTNALKDAISIQYIDLRDETVAVADMKESLCYVSPHFARDLERSWKLGPRQGRPVDWSIVVDWVLPDYDHTLKGHRLAHDPLKPLKARSLDPPGSETVVPLSNERFQIPELLFSPADIGLNEGGLPDLVMQSLEQLPAALWPGLLANIVVVGGTAKLPGLRERLEAEVRQRTPAEYAVRVAVHPDADKATWLGGARMAQDVDLMKSIVVTRQEYMEYGHTLNHTWASRQFQARGNALASAVVQDF